MMHGLMSRGKKKERKENSNHRNREWIISYQELGSGGNRKRKVKGYRISDIT